MASLIIPFPTDLRPRLPTIVGNVDYLTLCQRLEQIESLLQASGLEADFVEKALQGWLKPKPASRPATARQQQHFQLRSRRALRCTILRTLLQEDYRGFSCALAGNPLYQWFCLVDTLEAVRVPSKSELQRFAHWLEAAQMRHTFAKIVGRVPIGDLGIGVQFLDFKTIESNKATGPTSKQALVKARVGQVRFGFAVREFWNYRCSVTGSSTQAVLEASHIKGWKDSNDSERLDPNNGLLLTANLHKLFDAGLISFDNSGAMCVSSELSHSEKKVFGLIGKKLSKKPSPEIAQFLLYHRDEVFRSSST